MTFCGLSIIIGVDILAKLVDQYCLGWEGKELWAEGADSSIEAVNFNLVVVVWLWVFEFESHVERWDWRDVFEVVLRFVRSEGVHYYLRRYYCVKGRY